MRVHVAWVVLLVLVSGVLVATLFYQRSWIPAYGEAEPLYPAVAEFGRELAQVTEGAEVAPTDVAELLRDERFESIRPYGIVFSTSPEILVSIRINERYSFDIREDGHPRWNRKF
ncbi:MAG: hypothetical protein ACPG4K_05815 [Haloferula sp.]